MISPNFLVWKFCGKAHFSRVSGDLQKLCRNCALPQNFHTSKLREITVFYAGILYTVIKAKK